MVNPPTPTPQKNPFSYFCFLHLKLTYVPATKWYGTSSAKEVGSGNYGLHTPPPPPTKRLYAFFRTTSTIFLYFFGGLECVGHSFAYVAHFYFWEMSSSNPESYRSKQARYQFRHPSPYLATHLSTYSPISHLSHPSSYLATSPYLATHLPT